MYNSNFVETMFGGWPLYRENNNLLQQLLDKGVAFYKNADERFSFLNTEKNLGSGVRGALETENKKLRKKLEEIGFIPETFILDLERSDSTKYKPEPVPKSKPELNVKKESFENSIKQGKRKIIME